MVGGTEAGDEKIFEHLDGMFSGIDAVFVWRYKLPCNVLVLEVVGDGGRCFVVEHVEVWLETFAFEISEYILKGIDNSCGFMVRYRLNNDGICGVVICDKNLLLVFNDIIGN